MEILLWRLNKMSPEEILEQAKTFYNQVRETGRYPNYHDYERFKKLLHNEGLFGYEFQLAQILHL